MGLFAPAPAPAPAPGLGLAGWVCRADKGPGLELGPPLVLGLGVVGLVLVGVRAGPRAT